MCWLCEGVGFGLLNWRIICIIRVELRSVLRECSVKCSVLIPGVVVAGVPARIIKKSDESFCHND